MDFENIVEYVYYLIEIIEEQSYNEGCNVTKTSLRMVL